MTPRERRRIESAVFHLDIMDEHLTRGPLDDQLVMDAVCMRVSAAIEELSQLPAATRTELFDLDWAPMWSTRNRIAHGYLELDDEIITDTVLLDIPVLRSQLTKALAPESGTSPT